MRITITTTHPASRHGQPVCLIDGQSVSDREGLIAACKALKWSRDELSRQTGKSKGVIDRYRTKGKDSRPVPAEVWNRLRDALEQQQEGESKT